MEADTFIQTVFLIFAGAAVIATAALYARQALPVGYIIVGALLGPWGLGLVDDAEAVQGMARGTEEDANEARAFPPTPSHLQTPSS